MALLELTRRHGVPIVEDDYSHEYCYRSLPTAPLAAAPGAPHVIYVGSLSKLIAPAVRVGFVSAQSPVLDQIARLVALNSVGGDAITQLALCHFIEDGALERHLWRTRRSYEERRDALAEALATHCKSFEFQLPEGGLALWGTCAGAESGAVATRALEHGLSLLPEALVRVKPQATYGLRLAFSRLPPSQAPDAARLLARVLSEARSGRPRRG
jgi:GntR family transcriptional regulator/MocR family aminotransferase